MLPMLRQRKDSIILTQNKSFDSKDTIKRHQTLGSSVDRQRKTTRQFTFKKIRDPNDSMSGMEDLNSSGLQSTKHSDMRRSHHKRFSTKLFTSPDRSQGRNKVQLIGTTAFSSVFKVEIAEIQKVFALKVKKVSPEHRERDFNITLLHNQVMYIDAIIQEGQRYINLVTDYLPMNLTQYLQYYKQKNRTIPKIVIKVLVFQLFRALAYLHESSIAHRDIQPLNILVDKDTYQLKICDFGNAKFMQRGEISNPEVGRKRYRAPELLLGAKNYTQAVDLWALGCTLFEMITMEPLFQGNSNEEVFSEIIKSLGTPTSQDLQHLGSSILDLKLPQIQTQKWQAKLKNAEIGLVDIISNLMQYQPQKRGDAFSYLLHPYFKELKKSSVKINGQEIPRLFDFTLDEMKLPRYQSQLHNIVPDGYSVNRPLKQSEEEIESLLKYI